MQRIFFYDAIKTFAIFLVCFYHGNTLNCSILVDTSPQTVVHYFLYSLASTGVPLFFMTSGALALNKNFSLSSNTRKIFKLFLMVYFWSFFLLIILKYLLHDTYTVNSFIKALFHLKYHRSNHLWFLQALISIYILLPLIKLAYDNEDPSILFFTMTALFVFSFGNQLINHILNIVLYPFDIDLFRNGNYNFFGKINPYGNYFYAGFYFIVGGLIVKKPKNYRPYKLVASFLTSYVLLFLYGLLMTHSNNRFYDTVFRGYNTVMTLTMSISLFILFSRMNYKDGFISKTVGLIGKNTLGIYILHIVFIRIIRPHVKAYAHSNNFFLNLVYILIILVLSLATTMILKRIKPLSFLLKT